MGASPELPIDPIGQFRPLPCGTRQGSSHRCRVSGGDQENPWWMVFFAPDNRADCMGIVAERDCQIKDSPRNSSRVFERWCEMSIPISCITVIAVCSPSTAGAGREHFVPVAVFCPQQPLCHLGTGGICRADKDDPGFCRHF